MLNNKSIGKENIPPYIVYFTVLIKTTISQVIVDII